MEPIKFKPILKQTLWGGDKIAGFKRIEGLSGGNIGESWEISGVKGSESIAANGPYKGKTLNEITAELQDKLVGADNYKLFGDEFPLLVKFIDACQDLSIQVHPDDEKARKYGLKNGKTEMWYILGADEGAGIYCGFKRDTDKEEFLAKVKDGTVEELLNFISVKEGDCFLIEAGTVHAIGAGCVICEVQQSSNVTYRVYDYNRRGADGKLRPLHVEKAVDVINFKAFEDHTNTGMFADVAGGKMRRLTGCKYFECRKLDLDGAYSEENRESFTAVNVLKGEGKADGNPFKAGDSFFVPCGEKFSLEGKAEIVLTTEGKE